MGVGCREGGLHRGAPVISLLGVTLDGTALHNECCRFWSIQAIGLCVHCSLFPLRIYIIALPEGKLRGLKGQRAIAAIPNPSIHPSVQPPSQSRKCKMAEDA